MPGIIPYGEEPDFQTMQNFENFGKVL
ncbi:uncharacterized protein METZ01_LOCUS329283 [marine metagenome]|uniref:Uncharacterized protein n=1 Tax=marine metagenome TaxID=408172 RepID=A0A382PSW4_9ZZZZ